MYKWKTLTYDFDKSKRVYKIRFNTDGSGLPTSISQVGFFAESPNINCDGLHWRTVSGATYGYASENRFWVNDNMFCNHYYGFVDERWSAHTHTTAITSTISEFDCPVALYYAGATAYDDVTFQTVLSEKVSVYVESNVNLSTSAVTFSSESSSSTITVTSSDNPWTATTQDSWITLSQNTGNTGETTITVSVSSNYFSDRTGTVSFTDGVDIVELTVNQKKNTSVKLRNIYLENNRIDKMYCNGDLIYQSLIKSVFSLSTDELIIETGQTGTFTITANDRWTITAPEWLTVSQNSGYGNATITVTMGSVESAGTIDVTCYNQTKSISVESQKDYSKEYLTFRVSSAGTINWIQTGRTSKTIQYSKNNGSWTSITSSKAGTSFNVVAGDVVRFKGSNTQYASSTSRYACFYNSTARFSIEGNIMSLISGDNFVNSKSISAQYTFYMLFRGRSGMGATSAENLILPATTLAQHCYQDMFYECFILTTPPKILPATTLQNYCYYDMFAGCRVLTKSPDLPAPTLAQYCYQGMFRVCPLCSYIKCLATSISATDCTNNWTSGVYGIGTFVKATSMTGWTTGVNGIPNNWTVIEE